MAWRISKTLAALRVRRHESGQVLIMAVIMLPMVLGMTAIAVDLGRYAAQRRSLQNDADAIALAAVQELPNATNAQAVAEKYASDNDIDTDNMTVTISGLSSVQTPKVTVQLDRGIDFIFARVIGIEQGEVGARAAAVKASFGGGDGIVPWGVLESVIDGAGNGELITMKYDSNNVNNGNFGAVSIDGSGSSTYEDEVKYGSTSNICAEDTPGCDPSDCPGTTCAENASQCDGSDCSTKAGNMTGPTRDGVDYRMDNTKAACDTFDETFTKDSSGNYRLDPECNPWIDNGAGSLRVIIIPIVDEFGNGTSDPLEVQSFAVMYLEGYDNNTCQGSSCEVKGRFIKNAITVAGLTGEYDPDALMQFTRLAE